MFELTEKVAIVTGGGSGIGAAICRAFGKQGAVVCILDLKDENGHKVHDDIINQNGTAFYYHCDIGNQSEVEQVVETIHAQQGRIDILVNNAGIAHIGTVETTTEDDLDRIYRVNVKGVYNGMKAVIPYMKSAGGGAIINLASVISVVGIADRFAYSMSKGAVLTMTYSVAKDYLEHGIRCNAVAPARIHTPFVDGYLKDNYPGREKEMYDALARTQPIGRMGRPDEVAALAVYLASDEAAFITGSLYPLDGGFITLNT